MGGGHSGPARRRHDSTSAQRQAFAAPRVRVIALRALALGGMAAGALSSAQAVTLGEIGVQSALGEPLNVRVPLTLAAGEVLGEGCVSAASGPGSGLALVPQPLVRAPAVSGAGTFTLAVTTQQPLYEPMYELLLQVRCPGTALLVRHYILMLDLPGQTASATAAPTPAPAASGFTMATAPATSPPVASRPPAAGRAQRASAGPAIEPGSTYRVVQGDTLSTIAARVKISDARLWTIAERIFAANPGAFVGGNEDLIKLGSEIQIPAETRPAAADAAPAAVATDTEAAASPVASGVSLPAAASTVPAGAERTTNDAPAPIEPDSVLVTGAVEEHAESAPPADPPVFTDERSPVTPDAQAPAKSAPRVEAAGDATASVMPQSRGPRQDAPTWLAALVGVLGGALASIALLRSRLLDAARELLRRRAPAQAGQPAPELSERPAMRHVLPAESTMLVEEGPAPEDEQPRYSHAAPTYGRAVPPAADVPASEAAFASLLGDVTTDPFDGGSHALDLDLTEAVGDAGSDHEIGWTGGQTELSPTLEVGIADTGTSGTAEQIDLQTLAQRGFDDAEISQTLKDALNLLESDYESELTASQVIDREKLQEVLDDGGDDTFGRTGTDHYRS